MRNRRVNPGKYGQGGEYPGIFYFRRSCVFADALNSVGVCVGGGGGGSGG